MLIVVDESLGFRGIKHVAMRKRRASGQEKCNASCFCLRVIDCGLRRGTCDGDGASTHGNHYADGGVAPRSLIALNNTLLQ